MTDILSRAYHAFTSSVLMSFSVDVTLFPKLVNLSTSFNNAHIIVEMSPLQLKQMYSVVVALGHPIVIL